MAQHLCVLGESLMDCIAQDNGQLLPLQGGSPYNMARAAALRGAPVSYLNPLSGDVFGVGLRQRLHQDGVKTPGPASRLPTSLAVIQLNQGQPSYGFYREGIADRDYNVADMLAVLDAMPAGVLHTGSLLLIPPEHHKVLVILQAARARGWTISIDINLRPKVADDLPAYVQAVREVMTMADWLKASDEDLHTMGFTDVALAQSPGLVRALRQQCGADRLSHVALTFGGDGAYLDVNGHAASAPVPAVKVQDTVGAGDTFWGNAVADWVGQADGAAQRVAQTLRLAMAAAAINCSRQGCQPPTLADTLAFA